MPSFNSSFLAEVESTSSADIQQIIPSSTSNTLAKAAAFHRLSLDNRFITANRPRSNSTKMEVMMHHHRRQQSLIAEQQQQESTTTTTSSIVEEEEVVEEEVITVVPSSPNVVEFAQVIEMERKLHKKKSAKDLILQTKSPVKVIKTVVKSVHTFFDNYSWILG